MKRFLIRILLFTFITIVILESLATYALYYQWEITKKHKWYRFYNIEMRSHTNIQSDTLFLGGSVANQLYRPRQSYNYLTSSAAMHIAGNYILAKNTIENNPQLKCIYYVFHPITLSMKFEHKKTYSSFIKPVFQFKNLIDFDCYLFKKIIRKPRAILSLSNAYKLINRRDVNYFDLNNKGRKIAISAFSERYLHKLIDLAQNHKIDLHLVCPPLSDSENRVKSMENLIQEGRTKGLETELAEYIENAVYISDTCFIDDIHYNKKYLKKDRLEIISLMKQIP